MFFPCIKSSSKEVTMTRKPVRLRKLDDSQNMILSVSAITTPNPNNVIITPCSTTTCLLTVSPKNVIMPERGDYLFQLASAYCIAKRHGRKLVAREHFEVSDYFQTNIIDDLNSAVSLQDIELLSDDCKGCFERSIFNLIGHQYRPEVHLDAYMQSWMYFSHAFDEVTSLFTSFRPDILDTVNAFFSNITKVYNDVQQQPRMKTYSTNIIGNDNKNDSLFDSKRITTTFVGVYVRRNFITPKHSKYVNDTGKFFERAMLHYVKPRRFHHVTFVVCSDDIDWSRTNVQLHNVSADAFRIVFCDKRTKPIVELSILSACNHSIITGGTLGWWSAFLAGGETVYFTGYPETRTGYLHPRTEYWLPSWIGIKPLGF